MLAAAVARRLAMPILSASSLSNSICKLGQKPALDSGLPRLTPGRTIFVGTGWPAFRKWRSVRCVRGCKFFPCAFFSAHQTEGILRNTTIATTTRATTVRASLSWYGVDPRLRFLQLRGTTLTALSHRTRRPFPVTSTAVRTGIEIPSAVEAGRFSFLVRRNQRRHAECDYARSCQGPQGYHDLLGHVVASRRRPVYPTSGRAWTAYRPASY